MTDSGTAVPAANVLNVLGGLDIATAGSGNTITIAFTGSLTGLETLTGNSGGAVPGTVNNVNTVGTGSITIVGNPGTSTLTTQLTGLTNHNVLVGAGTATITNVSPSTAGFVLISNGLAADPSFQAISAAGGISSITGNSGGAEVPSVGNFNILGTGSITVAGSANTETVQLTGLTNHSVLIGAGTATITNVAPSATAAVPLVSNGASADPSFGTSGVNGLRITGTTVSSAGADSNGILVDNSFQPSASINAACFIRAGATVSPAAGATITNSVGVFVPSYASAGLGTVTNAYGLWVDTPSAGASTNITAKIGNINVTGNTIAVNNTNGALTITSNGTGALNLGNNATSHATNLGSTTGTSTLQLSSGSGGVKLNSVAEGALVTSSTSVISTVTGTAGFVLTANAAGTAPSFQANGVSSLTLTGNTGGALSPTTQNFNILGTGSITVAGAVSTETVQLTGLTNHSVLIGAGTATITKVAPSASISVPLVSNGASADPSFGNTGVNGLYITGTNVSSAGVDTNGILVDASLQPSASVANACGIRSQPGLAPPVGITITSAAGVYVPALTNAGVGTITTAYGLLIDAPTAGLTNVYAQIGNIRITSGQIQPTNLNGTMTLSATGTGSVNIGTIGSQHTTNLGSTTGTSTLQLNSGSGGVKLNSVAEGALVTSSTSVISTVTGTAGFVLTANAAGTSPSFQAIPASSISITGNSGGALTGNSFTFNGGTSGLAFAGAGSTETLGGTLVVANGGTGDASFANTSALLTSGTTTTGALQNIASVATGQVLVSAGTSTIPAWSAAPSVTSITLGGGTALSNYAEGTWTPTLVFGVASTGITYTQREGYYTRIGRVVFVEGMFVLSSKGSSTGTAFLTGFPITSANTNQAPFIGFVSNNLTPDVGYQLQAFQLNANNTSGGWGQVNLTTGALTNLTDVNFANACSCYVDGFYFV